MSIKNALALLLVVAVGGMMLTPVALQAADATEAVAPASAADQQSDRVEVPPATDKALRYYRSGNLLWWVNTFFGVLIPVLFLWTGFSARLRTWATGIGRKWFLSLAVFLVAYNLIGYLLQLPLSYYQGFVRQHAYGLSNQTLGKWVGDSLTSLLVGLIVAVLVTWVPYTLIRKSPRRWWLYTGLAIVPFIFFFNMVAPIWVAPLYNDFGPMQDKQLEAQILSLADRAGIEGSRVFEVNKSVDTEAVNAYVTGFLATKRIVLWDTIIAKLTPKQLLFVMGHEMGHYVLKHIIVLTVVLSAAAMLGLYLIYRLSGALIARYRERFGFDELGDFASLPLLSLLIGAFFFLISPAFLGLSRHLEHQADIFGLELTHDNRACAEAFVTLQEENLGNPYPGPVYKLWRAGHPTLGERIEFCNDYRPWETGAEERYSDRFSVSASD